jgi:hypothetical protein
MARVASGQKGRCFRFRRPFLWFISFGRTKEMNGMISVKPNQKMGFGATPHNLGEQKNRGTPEG